MPCAFSHLFLHTPSRGHPISFSQYGTTGFVIVNGSRTRQRRFVYYPRPWPDASNELEDILLRKAFFFLLNLFRPTFGVGLTLLLL